MSDQLRKNQMEYFVSKGEENLGPLSIVQVAELLASSDLAVTDFIYDEHQKDWIPLLECQALKEHLKLSKPKAPPKPTVATSAGVAQAKPVAKSSGDAWYVQKGVERHGPFSYLEVVRCMQDKLIYDFDFIWKEGMETWVRIAETEVFSPQKIQELSTHTHDLKGRVFLQRQNKRVKIDSEVIVHDNHEVWMGKAFEASVAGSGLLIENATLKPGQLIRIHFSASNGWPAFNTMAEIVGKCFSKEVKGAHSAVKYSVRFVELSQKVAPLVRDCVEVSSAS